MSKRQYVVTLAARPAIPAICALHDDDGQPPHLATQQTLPHRAVAIGPIANKASRWRWLDWSRLTPERIPRERKRPAPIEIDQTAAGNHA
jgi:hypothetical protein